MKESDIIKEADIKQTTDPTLLTTQMTQREISALKELMTSRIAAVEKGIDIAHQDLVRVPTEVQKQVGHLKEVMDLKVLNLENQFGLIEKQRVEQKSDTRMAIDDALKAAKELVVQQNLANNNANAKTEASFSKQIEQQAERINDLKERLAKAEGRSGGMRDFVGWIVAAIAILFTILNYFGR